jgi:hypothetical protein
VVGRLDDRAAIVQRPDGQRAVALSSVPLWTENASQERVPVDLSVQAQGGGFGPASPVVATRMGERVGGGVALGGVLSFQPEVGDAQAVGEAFGDKVFYADVGPEPDTDFMVAAIPGGAEALWVLRSPRAGEEHALAFSLPQGAELELDEKTSGGARVVRDGEVLSRIAPPAAVDADGTAVEAAYRVEGARLVTAVAHRDEDVKYPVEVDPAVAIVYGNGPNGNAGGFAGWNPWEYNCGSIAFSDWRTNPQFVQFGVGGWTAGCYGRWRYHAPGSAYVFEMDLSSMSHYTDGGTAVWYGIVNADGSSPGGGAYTNGNDPPVSSQPAAEWGRLTYVARRVCTSGYDNNGGLCPSTVGNPGNVAFFGLYNGTSKYYPERQTALVYGTTVYLGDRTPPNRPTFSGLPASGWVRPGTSFGIAATQGGIGIQGFRLNFPAAGYNNRFLGVSCSLSYQPPYAPCPQQASATIGIPTTTAEGIHQVSANATTYDLSGSSSSTTVRLDGSGPTLEPAGRLWDHRNQQTDHRREGLYDQSYSVQLKAGDGSTASQAAQRSGTKAIDVRVRNAAGSIVQNSPDPAPQTCAAGNCAKTRDWTLNTDSLPDGDYTIEVVATDQIANTSTKSWPVTIDRRGDIVRAAGFEDGSDITGERTALEWVQYGTLNARREDVDSIQTRGSVTCPTDSTRRCGEVRFRSVADTPEDGPPAFSLYRGVSETDERLERVAAVNESRGEVLGTPQATGPIQDALAPWQHPPPAGASTFELHERSEAAADGDSEPTVRELWLDPATQLPLRERERVGDEVELDLRYSYDRQRLEAAQVPGDLFSVARPDPAGEVTEVDYATQPEPTLDEPAPAPQEEILLDAIGLRESLGLRADRGFVQVTLQAPSLTASTLLVGIPLLAAEEREIDLRLDLQEDLNVVRDYGATQASDAFAGAYIDQRAGGLVYVAFTKDAEEHMRVLRSLFPRAERLRSADADATLAQLGSLREQVERDWTSGALASAGIDATQVGEDERANRVLLGVRSPTETQRATVRSRYGDLVELVARQPAETTRRIPPLFAGVRIASTQLCSAGYALKLRKTQDGRRTTSYRLLTAGHCGRPGQTWRYSTGSGVFRQTGRVGRMSRNARPASPPEGSRPTVDAAMITMAPSARSSLIRRSPTTFLPTRAAQRKDGGNSVDEGGQGDIVCQGGASTYARTGREVCGVLVSKNVTRGFEEGHVARGLNVADYPACVGDSGGPVFDRRGVALGVNTGGTGVSAAGGGFRCNSRDDETFFTQISIATFAMGGSGASLVTRRPSFTAPLVRTGESSDITTTTATANGSVRPGGLETTYWFEYGRTTAYGQQTPMRTLEAGTAERAVAGDLTGLDPGSTVHVRLVARNTVDTETGADSTFTTAGAP